MICIWLSLVPDVLQLANRAPGTKILIKVLPNVQPSDDAAETKGERKKIEKKHFFFFSLHHLGNNSHSLRTLSYLFLHLEFDCNLRLPFLLWWDIMLQCTAPVFKLKFDSSTTQACEEEKRKKESQYCIFTEQLSCSFSFSLLLCEKDFSSVENSLNHALLLLIHLPITIIPANTNSTYFIKRVSVTGFNVSPIQCSYQNCLCHCQMSPLVRFKKFVWVKKKTVRT